MKRICYFIIFFIISYCFSIFTIYADIDRQYILWDEYVELRDSVYNNSYDLDGIKNLYTKAVESANLNFTGNDLSIALSRCDFILGLYYTFTEKKELASQTFDTGIAFAELALKNHKDDYLATLMYAENLCQNCGVKPFSYVVKNGPKIQVWADKTLTINPNSGSAMYLLYAQYIFAPAPFANYKKGLNEMYQVLQKPNVILQKDDTFNITSAIGYAYFKLQENEKAVQWLNKSLEIYPDNLFVNSLMSQLNNL